ncbi:hypothetical protein [Streptomyces sp. HUAS CX7]|uniref:hypothetical protein n=1 Tax=Streptomyces sp. HUAS CX7 TaxID=3062782 RepID=UPI0026F326C9|nr:hypothetical protein [Streptomyces sp. HUAS CX7]WKX23632.1 hypothetical protein Q3Y68_36695 [Streptomyces sp. HUAS CX7]
MGDQDDAVAEKRDASTSSHDPFLQLDVGDAAFVDPGVVMGRDSLGDGMSVFVQGSCEAGERSESALCEVTQPAWHGCRVLVVDHGGEAAGQVVGELEFGAVFEEPGQALVGP